MATRQYIGARYIPVFADPVQWNINNEYSYLTMVQNAGETYMSKQAVPTGISLPNTSQGEESNEYWVHMSNWNAQVESYREEVLAYNGRISTVENDLPISYFTDENTVKDNIDNLQTQLGNVFDEDNTVADAIDNLQDQIGDGFDEENTVEDAFTAEINNRKNEDSIRIISFETVSDMKSSDELEAGMVCHTSGFRSTGDNGASFYIISDTGTANELDVIACGDLYANFIDTYAYVTPEMFGAYGDGTHDDTDAIEKALTFPVVEFSNKTYLVTDTLYMIENQIINGNNCTLKQTTTFNMFYITQATNAKINNVHFKGIIHESLTANDGYFIASNSVETDYSMHDLEINNCSFNGGCSQILLNSGKDVKINKCVFKNATALTSGTGGGYNILLHSCKNVYISECKFTEQPFGRHDIYVSIDGAKLSQKQCENVIISDCVFDDDAKTGSGTSTAVIHNRGGKYVTVKDSVFIKPSSMPVTTDAYSVEDYVIENCKFFDSIQRTEAACLFSFNANPEKCTAKIIHCYFSQTNNARPYLFEVGSNAECYIRDIVIESTNGACAFSAGNGAVLNIDDVSVNSTGYWLSLTSPSAYSYIGRNINRVGGGGALMRTPVTTPMISIFDPIWLTFTHNNSYGFTPKKSSGLSVSASATGNAVVLTLNGNTETTVPSSNPYGASVTNIAPAVTPTITYSAATGGLVVFR